MLAFSISAPQLTEEDQQREVDALTEKERIELEESMNGTARFLETDEIARRGLAEFQQEVAMIPTEEKEAYLEALRRAPRIVETETDPIKFLRCEHFDAKQAAKRMVKNWEMRHAAFGEKAFEPMTLEGALSEDRETLQTGFFQLLQTGNEEKRAILLFDRPKLSHEIYNRDSAHRVMWYMFHVASEHAFTQRNGAIIVVNALHYTIDYFDRKLCKRLWQSVEEFTPMKLSAVHLCTVKSRSMYTIIMPCVLALMGKHNRLRTLIHASMYAEEMSKTGLSASCIPTELGGDVSLDDHKQWVEERSKVEREN